MQAVELLTEPEEKLSKCLNELRVNEGIILYVEEKTEQTEDKRSKWEQEFELEINRYQIKYNLLEDDPAKQKSDLIYTQTMVIDRRSTVLDLKQKISEAVGVPLENLVFRRGGFNGAELVEEELSFKQVNIYNMMSIFIQKGEPTRQGWKKIRFFLTEFYNADWSKLPQEGEENFRDPHDHEFYTFVDLGQVAIRVLDKVADVKAKLIEKFKDRLTGLKPADIRLRDKLNEKLA